jgi:hypothetical protein
VFRQDLRRALDRVEALARAHTDHRPAYQRIDEGLGELVAEREDEFGTDGARALVERLQQLGRVGPDLPDVDGT